MSNSTVGHFWPTLLNALRALVRPASTYIRTEIANSRARSGGIVHPIVCSSDRHPQRTINSSLTRRVGARSILLVDNPDKTTTTLDRQRVDYGETEVAKVTQASRSGELARVAARRSRNPNSIGPTFTRRRTPPPADERYAQASFNWMRRVFSTRKW